MTSLAGQIELGVGPSAAGFWDKFRADLKKQKTPNIDVEVNPDLKRADAELAAWRARQGKNAVNIPVKIDDKQLSNGLKRIESTFKTSDFRKAIRVQVLVVGAEALPALTQGALSATTALTELGQAALVLPGILGGLAATVGTLFTGLNGLKAAFTASNEATQKSTSTLRDYHRATRDLERAQRDVTTAIKDASRQIQDQHDKLTQGALSVEQAQINIQRANEALAKGGFKSMSEWRQALLDQKTAYFDYGQTVKQTGRDVQDYYDNANRGIQNNDKVRDSVDKLSDSVDAYGKAQNAASGYSDKFIDAMKSLSPAAQDFVTQILALRPAWEQLQNVVSSDLLSGLGKSISDVANKDLPVLRTGMQQVARGLNSDFKSLLASLGSDANRSGIARIFENTGTALNKAAPGLNSFVTGLLHLSDVGSRFLPRFAEAFDRIGDRFNSFVDRADKDGSLDRWINRGLIVIDKLFDAIGSIGSILNSVTDAYEKATGNIGGFASTAANSLGKLAGYLKSPAGQAHLVNYLHQADGILQQLKKSLPGILQLFGSFAQAARTFGQYWLPALSSVGKFLQQHITLVKYALGLWLSWRTIRPIISTVEKGIGRWNSGIDNYNKKMALVGRLMQDRAALEAQVAANEARQAQAVAAAEQQKNDALLRQVALRNDLAAADERLEALDAAAAQNATGRNAQGRFLPKWQRDKVFRPELGAFQDIGIARASIIEDRQKALSRLEGAEKDYARAVKATSDIQTNSIPVLNNKGRAEKDEEGRVRTLASVNKDLRGEVRNVDQAISQLSGGGGSFGKLRNAIGARGSGGVAGAMGGLAAAFGGVVTAIGGLAIGAGLTYALDQLSQAHDRARRTADAQKQSEDALNNTLQEGTGAATQATLKQNIAELQNHVNPYDGSHFDATKTLQSQLGLSIPQQAQLSLPTQQKQLNAAVAPADAKVIAAVPNLAEWKQWGEEFRKNGVDERVYGMALNGDQDAVGKVEAARRAIYNGTGDAKAHIPFGVGVSLGEAPNDLGHGQSQLPDPLRQQSLAVGALRGTQNAGIAAGSQQQAQGQAIANPGLNALGSRTFGPFRIAPNGVSLTPDGGANIATDANPDDVVKGWSQGVLDKGISVQPRAGGGAVMSLTPDAVKRYFNTSAPPKTPGFAGGGFLGNVSNGEMLFGPDDVGRIGAGNLAMMNGGMLPHYDSGGPVLGGAQDRAGTNQFFKTIWNNTGGALWNGIQGAFGGNGGATVGPSGGAPVGGAPGVGGTLNRLFFAGSPQAPLSEGPYDPSPKLPGLLLPGQGLPGPAPISAPSALVPKAPPVPKPVPNHALGGNFQPGPGGASSAPGSVPGTTFGLSPGSSTPPATPTSTPSPASTAGSAPAPLQPGQIPTYDQLGTGYTAGPYVPNLAGSGALPEIKGNGHDTFASHAPNAPIIPSANILDYLTQVAKASGLKPGSGPGSDQAGDAGSQIAAALGIPTHSNDGALHSVDRALDIGSLDQANSGAISAFVKQWMSDPQKVASTRQLIFRGPDGDYGIINGRVLTGPELQTVYGGDLNDHKDHVHLGLEGVPLGALGPDGQGAPLFGQGSANYVPFSGTPGGGPAPVDVPAPSGPPGSVAAGIPGGIPGITAPINGPFGPVPFDGMNIIQQLGQAFLQLIGGFFGIDLSGILGLFNKGAGAFGGGQGPAPTADPADPGPDQSIVQNLIQQATEAKQQGNQPLAEALLNDAKAYQTRGNPQPPAGAPGQPWKANTSAYVSGSLEAALQAQGFSPEQIRLVQGFSKVEGNNPAGTPTLGFTDSQLGGATDLQSHVNALAKQFKDRAPVAGPFPAGGSDQQKAQWIAKVVGQSGLSSDWQGNAQPQDYVQRVMAAMGGGSALANGGFPRMGNGSVPAMVSNGEFFFNNDAVKRIGAGNLLAANHLASGGMIRGPGTGRSDSIKAILPPGGFVMKASAVNRLGASRLRRLADGGIVHADGGFLDPIIGPAPNMPPPGPLAQAPPGQPATPGTPGAPGPPPAPGTPPATPVGEAPMVRAPAELPQNPMASGPVGAGPQPLGPQQGQPGSSEAGSQALGNAAQAAQGLLSPKGSGQPGASPPSGASQQSDPRAILGAAPTSQDHNLPALSQGVQGAAGAIGAIAGMAAQMGITAGTMGAGAAGGGLANQGIQAGAQLAGQTITGALNILSSLAVGTLTPGTTGAGYGAPLLPQQPGKTGVRQFQSIHNGNVNVTNLDDYTRTRQRMDAQRQAPFLNRIG